MKTHSSYCLIRLRNCLTETTRMSYFQKNYCLRTQMKNLTIVTNCCYSTHLKMSLIPRMTMMIDCYYC